MTTSEYPMLVGSLRASFNSGKTSDIEWRIAQLRQVIKFCREQENALAKAVFDDLRKPRQEAVVTDIQVNVAEAEYALRNLKDWARPLRAAVPLALQPASAEVRYEPYGVALIIGAWNYPVQLVIQPLVAALSAGNCALIKPSELAPATAATLARLLPEYLDPECVAVVEGGVAETTALLEQRFDKIFYTGNGRVGRIVMGAAARHLTPVSLELGGKSPAIVDETGDMDQIGRRLVWGRFLNAGQTCVAPDYVLIKRERRDALVESLRKAIKEFYGEQPQASPDLARVVNERHFEWLLALLEGHQIAIGGEHDASDRYLSPTVVTDPDPESPLMQDEIFGPILPVLAFDGIDEAIAFINGRDKPLSLYVFSRNTDTQRRVIDSTRSGGVVVNDSVVHLGCLELPFGGVGESGMGSYHGFHGFEAFSTKRAVMTRATFIDPPLRYPPYSESKLRWIKRLL
ncbi:MAG: aldehyde dehydrogenase family protein [Myxococcota bacterium]